jgi:hypothetical protein
MAENEQVRILEGAHRLGEERRRERLERAPRGLGAHDAVGRLAARLQVEPVELEQLAQRRRRVNLGGRLDELVLERAPRLPRGLERLA